MKKIIFSVILLSGFSVSAYSSYVYKVKGDVFYREKTGAEWKKLSETSEKMTLRTGCEIKTARASSIEIFMDDGSKVKLAPGTFFKLDEESQSDTKINLFSGKIRNWVKKFSKRFQVKTPTAVCAVRGTDFMVGADNNGNTRVEVYDGSVLAGDSKGRESLVKRGEFLEVSRDGGLNRPRNNPNPPQNMDSSLGDRKMIARKEIYTEISKEDVIKQAQSEMQMSEYQNRKVAVDAFGRRVRMEEYIIRPADDQFKYVALNQREGGFNFGKMLFTFNAALPDDLTLATANMLASDGASAPAWYLTAMNSVISNTLDKVTEDASGGHMVADNPSNPSGWEHFFTDYSVYFAGPSQGSENGDLGRLLWGYSDANNNNAAESGEFLFLGNRTVTATTAISDNQTRYTFSDGSTMLSTSLNPSGDGVFDNIISNEYSDGAWISARDFVLFDNGKIVSTGDFASGIGGATKSEITDKLNFERVYTSSLFEGREIDLEFSAKLLKDAGVLRF